MSRTALFVTISLFAIAVPMTLPQAAACNPVADQSVTTLPTPAATLYVKTSPFNLRPGVNAPFPSEIWRETNGIPGLQVNREMACDVADGDFHWVDARF